MRIDTSFDFSLDSPRYWDGFWDNRNGLGVGSSDPDSASKTLQKYHQMLWSKELPCGERMLLERGSGPYYLTWKVFRFGSDSILVSFRYDRRDDHFPQTRREHQSDEGNTSTDKRSLGSDSRMYPEILQRRKQPVVWDSGAG